MATTSLVVSNLGYQPVNGWCKEDGDGSGAGGPIKTGNAAKDGTAGVTTLITCPSGAFGEFVNNIRFVSAGTNVRSLARIYINNGSSNSSAANNKLVAEVALPPTQASSEQPAVVVPVPGTFTLMPNQKIMVSLETTVAAGWNVYCDGGAY